MNAVSVHANDDSSNSSPSTSTMLTTTTTTTAENVGRTQIKRPTSLNVPKPAGRFESTRKN